MSLNYNLYVEQGADFRTVITVSNDDGTAKDLSGYEAQSQMRRSYTASTSFPIEANIINALNGEITLSISAEATAVLKPGRFVYDMIITDADGVVTRVIEGIVTVSPSVTREEI